MAKGEILRHDDDGLATGMPLLVVEDFRQYLVADRAGMTVEFVVKPSRGRPTGQRGWMVAHG